MSRGRSGGMSRGYSSSNEKAGGNEFRVTLRSTSVVCKE